MDCDEDALYDLIHEGVTRDCVNERDRSGRVGGLFKILVFHHAKGKHCVVPFISGPALLLSYRVGAMACNYIPKIMLNNVF